ncbi:MAG: GspH/FimT family pseudopilin [Planctomycetota bacterium]|nr:GspH/FimT family pseudopilin [Planctomycetota bacterium]
MKRTQRDDRRCSGFTIIEVMIVVLIMGMIAAIVIPNLGMFVPEARLNSAAQQLVSNIDFARSEARIQGKRVTLEFDLENERWRYVLPPEEQLTSDQDVQTLETNYLAWQELEEDVEFESAGNATNGLVRDKIFQMVFDENGFTSDQSIILQLASDPQMTWTVQIHGLTGRCEVIRDYEGEAHPFAETGEGMF